LLTYCKVCLAMRFDFVVSLVITLLSSWILVNVWRAVFAGSAAIRGTYTESEFITYIAVAQVVNLARMGLSNRQIVYRSMGYVRSGQIAIDLVRPLDVQAMRYAEWAAVFLCDALLVAAPVWIVWYVVGGISAPASPLYGALFVVSFLLGWLVMSGLHYLVNMATIWSEDFLGIQMARTALQEFFGGSLIPLAIMPPAFLAIAAVLPFQAIVFTPVWIYLGRLQGGALFWALTVQVLWGVGLLLLGRWLCRYAAPHLRVLGG
ncbi:MAG: ABC transporter permease, partial [Chloroflexota bacterium]